MHLRTAEALFIRSNKPSLNNKDELRSRKLRLKLLESHVLGKLVNLAEKIRITKQNKFNQIDIYYDFIRVICKSFQCELMSEDGYKLTEIYHKTN